MHTEIPGARARERIRQSKKQRSTQVFCFYSRGDGGCAAAVAAAGGG